jgi:uncharacterized Zn finger protein
MAAERTRGTTPLEGFAAHFERVVVRCPACGHEDEQRRWTVSADGRSVEYSYTCTSCGAVERRSLTLRP